MKIRHHTINVNGLGVFYREAGPTDAPALLLLHGFPSSGHMFRDLIPLLADKYRVIAPDLPGFGQTDLPSRETFTYSFANLAEVIGNFTEAIGLAKFAIYIFDYGAPTGLRVALKYPERIAAIISQNGNAYEEGLSDGWNPIRAYWQEKSQANRDALRAFLQPEATLFQYTHGVADVSLVSPDGRSLDDFYLARPGGPMISSSISSAITRATWRCIPSFRSISASISRPFSRCGVRTIPSSCRPARKGISGILRMPR